MLTFFTLESSVTFTVTVTMSLGPGGEGLIVGVAMVGGVLSTIGALRFVQTIEAHPLADGLVPVG